MEAPAGTSWGQEKEILLTTYKLMISSIIHYAAPIWFPNASPSAIQSLQSVQNAAFRIATEELQMLPVSHLHTEASMLPLNESLALRCRQYLASAMRTDRPSHGVVTAYSRPRDKKETLQNRFLSSIQYFLQQGTLPTDSHPTAFRHSTLKQMHKQSLPPTLIVFWVCDLHPLTPRSSCFAVERGQPLPS